MLKTKHGFVLLEVVCAISVFSIMSLLAFKIYLSSLNLSKYNKQICEYTLCLDGLKNNMKSNFSLSGNRERTLYLKKEYINLNKLKDKGIQNEFIDEKPSEEPYIEINITESNPLKVELTLKYCFKGYHKQLQTFFYKGRENEKT